MIIGVNGYSLIVIKDNVRKIFPIAKKAVLSKRKGGCGYFRFLILPSCPNIVKNKATKGLKNNFVEIMQMVSLGLINAIANL